MLGVKGKYRNGVIEMEEGREVWLTPLVYLSESEAETLPRIAVDEKRLAGPVSRA